LNQRSSNRVRDGELKAQLEKLQTLITVLSAKVNGGGQ